MPVRRPPMWHDDERGRGRQTYVIDVRLIIGGARRSQCMYAGVQCVVCMHASVTLRSPAGAGAPQRTVHRDIEMRYWYTGTQGWVDGCECIFTGSLGRRSLPCLGLGPSPES